MSSLCKLIDSSVTFAAGTACPCTVVKMNVNMFAKPDTHQSSGLPATYGRAQTREGLVSGMFSR
jgi:hypothetical protein